MKIGLIGINRYAKFLNFACNLHVYAFQQFLTQNGYESTVIDYKPAYFNNFNMRHPAEYAEAKYRAALKRNATSEQEVKKRDKESEKWRELAEGYRAVYVEREQRYDKFEKFIAENIQFTDQVYDSDLLEVRDPGFDAYICVTDVIWQTIARHTFDRGFLLGSKAFEGKSKISYAASRGASGDLTEKQAELFFGYLRDIDAISVRERDFSEYIENRSELSAPTVLDPTLLHGKEFWQEVSAKPREERYVLLYYVMEQAEDTIQKAVDYAKMHDLTIVELSDRPFKFGKISDPNVRHVPRYDVGLEEWLGYIENAECVFTNSFHGCCFSLLFETPFFAGRRNGQKVPNFLATFGLDSRRFGPDDDVRDFTLDIDYSTANRVLESEREHSRNFILTALEEAANRVNPDALIDSSAYDLKRQSIVYPFRFHSGKAHDTVMVESGAVRDGIQLKQVTSGALEYAEAGARLMNDGSAVLPKSSFAMKRHEFIGWNLRFRIDNRWFWCLDDGSIVPGTVEGTKFDHHKKVIDDLGTVPYLPVNHISVAVFVAQWREIPTKPKRIRDRLTPPSSIPRRAISKARRTTGKAFRRAQRFISRQP